MKKTIQILALLFLSTIAQAQTQIDSIQFIGATADSLEFMVHSSIDIEVIEYYIESESESDIIKVNIFYSGLDIDCYCPVQTTIKIKKEIYKKAIVTILLRSKIGGTEENPEYSDYWTADSKEIDLENITNVDNPTVSNMISIFPNPAKDYLLFKTEKQFEIIDMQGRVLLKSEKTTKSININHLKAGVYFIKFEDGRVEKFVKE